MSHKVIKSCNIWIMLDLWTLKYPCINISPNLFLQKCKQQHLDKLKEVKTPWVLVSASNGGHSMIIHLLPQLTKSNILWFLLDFWPLNILAPTWTQLYFFRNASSSTKVYQMKWKHHGYMLAHQIVATQWLHIYCVNSQKVTFCDLCLTFDP